MISFHLVLLLCVRGRLAKEFMLVVLQLGRKELRNYTRNGLFYYSHPARYLLLNHEPANYFSGGGILMRFESCGQARINSRIYLHPVALGAAYLQAELKEQARGF